MTPPKHVVRIRVVFGVHVPARQIENMRPTLQAFGNFFEEDTPRSFILEAQREGKRKALLKILTEWEVQGFIRWEEIG